MEEPPSGLISKVNKCIENYERKYKRMPNRVIVNNGVLELLRAEPEPMLVPETNSKERREPMLVSEENNKEKKSYTGYLLNNDKEKIEVHKLEKLHEKKQSELAQLTKGMEYPIIFCSCRAVKKFKDPLPYDMGLTTEELNQKLEKEDSESQ